MKTQESQVKTLLEHLLSGATIDRVEAFRQYGIADLRSRICNVEKDFNIRIDRRTKEGKRYKEYFVTNRQLNLL